MNTSTLVILAVLVVGVLVAWRHGARGLAVALAAGGAG